jgi:hypothetical protein
MRQDLHAVSRESSAAVQTARRLRQEITGLEQIFRPERIPGVSLCVATSAPWLGIEDLVTLGRLGLWIFAFDDLVDEHQIETREVELRVRQYVASAQGRMLPEVAYDPLARWLVWMSDGLKARCGGGVLWRHWIEEMRRMLHAMLWERVAADSKHPNQSLREYLDHAVHTIGVGSAAATAWILLGEPARALPQPLIEITSHAAIAVRLANDLRTYAREKREGTLNALAYLDEGGHVLLEAWRDREMALIRAKMLRKDLQSSRAAAFVHGFASFFLDLYSVGDVPDLASAPAY